MTLHVLLAYMQMMKFDPEWDRIDRTTLDEVEKSWAHSRCREVVFDVSTTSKVSVYCMYVCS